MYATFNPAAKEGPVTDTAAAQIIVDSDLPDSAWVEALPLALRFWQKLIEEPLLSESFRNIAVQMLHYVQHDIAVKIRE